jgi:Ca2+-binding EF-hand superfamily protein
VAVAEHPGAFRHIGLRSAPLRIKHVHIIVPAQAVQRSGTSMPNPFTNVGLTLVSLALATAAVAAPATKAVKGSGDVTRAEMLAEVQLVFDRADSDKDGFMSLPEFRARMGAVLNRTPPGATGAPTKVEAQQMLDAAMAAFKAVDTDGDGKLSRTEANKRPLAAFDMMDTDHNGVLTLAEKAAAARKRP